MFAPPVQPPSSVTGVSWPEGRPGTAVGGVTEDWMAAWSAFGIRLHVLPSALHTKDAPRLSMAHIMPLVAS